MSYELRFQPTALSEWRKLDGIIREQLKHKLPERLEHPRVPASRLADSRDRYKIKVRDSILTVLVVAVGRSDRSAVYRAAKVAELPFNPTPRFFLANSSCPASAHGSSEMPAEDKGVIPASWLPGRQP